MDNDKAKRSEEFKELNETREVPGMIRWFSKPCHYYIKNRGVEDKKYFKIGLESKIADGTYVWHEDIEFDVDEAADLMDKICEFNKLDKYTELADVKRKLSLLVKLLSKPETAGMVSTTAILGDLNDILEGI